MEDGERGKIITSFVTPDRTSQSSTRAMKRFESVIKNANVISDISDNLRNSLSEYPWLPSSDRVSTPDTRLHPSGNSIIPQEKEFAMYGDISDLEYNNST